MGHHTTCCAAQMCAPAGDTEPVIWGAVVRAVGFLAGAADLVVMLVLDVSLVGLLAQEVDCDLPDAHGVCGTCDVDCGCCCTLWS